MKKSMTFRFDQNLIETLKARAEQMDCSLTNLIETILRRWVIDSSEDNETNRKQFVKDEMDIKEIRLKTHLSKRAFARKYGIPYRTICSWEYGEREAPEYLLKLLNFKVECDVNG